MGRLTLRFRDRDLNRAFLQDYFAHNLWNVRAAHILGIILWVGWGFLLSPFLGEDRATDLTVRYGVLIPILVVGLGTTFLRGYRRWWEAEVVASMLGSSLVWTLYVASVHTMPVDFGYVGAILIIAFSFTLLRLRFLVVVLTGALIIVLYALMAMLPGGLTDLQMVLAAFYLVSFYLLGLFASYALERSTRLLFLRERELGAERARSEALLSNTLPRAIIDHLKARGLEEDTRVAQALDEVTVVFIDAVGFTEQAATTPPDQLVESLDELFSWFDALADRFGLEKIKTMGDAYMAVAGAPMPMTDHTAAAAEMALAVLAELEGRTWPLGVPIEVRIGLATGPAIAGVIGKRKFAYDLWGDTVNLARRLEAQAEPGRILVSEAAAASLEGRFAFSPPQVLDLKGMGPTLARLLLGHRSG